MSRKEQKSNHEMNNKQFTVFNLQQNSSQHKNT